jgi:hypothetical protein
MTKEIIYYTHHRAKSAILKGVQKQILKSGLPIVSCSLQPLDFGTNIVYPGKRGIISYFNQIVKALETSTADYVFFCEHDVLYHPSHFEFTPPRDDTFYYNVNVWRWDYTGKKIVTYDQVASVSGICVNRKLALDFYKNRLKIIYKNGWDKIKTFGNPSWARDLGYEPGRAGKRNKLEKAKSEEWRSEYPIIDIRHTRCMTIPRWIPEQFRKKPTNWREDIIDNIPGWEKPWNLVS